MYYVFLTISCLTYHSAKPWFHLPFSSLVGGGGGGGGGNGGLDEILNFEFFS